LGKQLTVSPGSVTRIGGTMTGNLSVNSDGSFTYSAPGASLGQTEQFRYFAHNSDNLDSVTPGIVAFTISTPLEVPPRSSSVNVVWQTDLDGMVQAAEAQWPGLTSAQRQTLAQTSFVVASLPQNVVEMAAANQVQIDSAGGGYGWFVDPTTAQNEEFTPGT